MVTYPEDFDPSEYGYSHEHDVYDEDYQPPKLEDFTIEERGATIRIELEGSYILPAQKENLDLVFSISYKEYNKKWAYDLKCVSLKKD